jgi:hypothetical protein
LHVPYLRQPAIITGRGNRMKYYCPLCGQPVAPSLYQKITGIWQERQKALQKIKEQRRRLLEKVAVQRKKLRKQSAAFRKQKIRLIKNAVDKQTRRLESKIKLLNRKQQEVKRVADAKIRIATNRAHRQAEKSATTRLRAFKKELRASVRVQLKKERERGARDTQQKYQRLNNTFRTTLIQMRVKSKQITEQRNKIRQLEKQLEKQTTPQWEGLLYEDDLTKELKKRFPDDQFEQTRKGGDILHNVVTNGHKAGLIVYECKRVQHYSFGHVKQASEAKQKRNADFAILVTNAMKKGTQGFFTERGVIVVHSAGIISLVGIVRNQIVRMAEMKLGQQERDKAIRRTLEYLEGPEFANSMDAIIQESIVLYREWVEEIRRHVAIWKRRYNSYQKISEEASRVKTTTRALLSGEDEYKKLVQTVSLPATLMLPELEESVSSQKSAEEGLSHEPGKHLRQNAAGHESVPNPSARSRART